MRAASKSAKVSKSRWIAELITAKLADEWPKAVTEAAGSWNDVPTIDTLRAELGADAPREPL